MSVKQAGITDHAVTLRRNNGPASTMSLEKARPVPQDKLGLSAHSRTGLKRMSIITTSSRCNFDYNGFYERLHRGRHDGNR